MAYRFGTVRNDGYYGSNGPMKPNNGSSSGSRGNGGNSGGARNSSAKKSSSSGSNYSFSFDPYLKYQQQLRDQRNNQYQSYLDQMRAAAQNAYNSNMGALNNAVSSRRGSLESGYNSAKETLKRQYDQSVADINADAERALRESWVNKRMTEKSLPQNLAAQGISGGASESTLARLNTDYGNSRNEVNTTRNDNLTEVGGIYQNGLASAEQQYRDALSELDSWAAQMQMQIQNDYANGIASSYDMSGFMQNDQAYNDALGKIIDTMLDYNYTQAKANNAVAPLSLTAFNDMGSSTNYAKAKALAEQLAASGADQASIISQLQNAGISSDEAYQIFASL